MPLFSRKSEPDVDAKLVQVRLETDRLQANAADPHASAWVSANAGTGKTHVLTLRVLRLLLAGTKPERILALTYTKAAAAEMSRRVYDKLAEWVVDDDAELKGKLAKLIDRQPTREEMTLARRLFAIAIETPQPQPPGHYKTRLGHLHDLSHITIEVEAARLGLDCK